jgi:hypothetical protein
MKNFPKVLVACPTAAAKNYTAEEWIVNTNKFYYPNYDIVMVDNTNDGGINSNYLNELAKKNNAEGKFWAGSLYFHNKEESVIEKMRASHQYCADLAIDKGYSHLLHLESDVIAPPETIDQLIQHNLPVVGALYYRDSGKSRRLMAQRHIMRSPKNIITENFLPEDDVCFVDGTLKKVASIGLGCVLINVDVLKKIKFRYIEGEEAHPDTYFSEDCFRNGIKIMADTSLICKHNNENWGVYGFNWK